MAYEDDENGIGSLKNTIDNMFKRGNSDSAIKPKLLFTRRKQSSDKLDPFPSRSAPAGGLDKPPAMPPIPPREKIEKNNFKYGADEIVAQPAVSGPPAVPKRTRKTSRNTFGTIPVANSTKEPKGKIRKTGSNNGSLFGSALLAPIKNSLTRKNKKDKSDKDKNETGSKLSKDNESIASVESSLPPNFRYSRLSNSSKSNLPPIRVSSRQQLSYEEMEKSNEWKKTIRQNANGTVGTRRQMGTTMNTGTLREQRDLDNHSGFFENETPPAPTSQEDQEQDNNEAPTRPGLGSFFKKVFRR